MFFLITKKGGGRELPCACHTASILKARQRFGPMRGLWVHGSRVTPSVHLRRFGLPAPTPAVDVNFHDSFITNFRQEGFACFLNMTLSGFSRNPSTFLFIIQHYEVS